MAPRAHRVAGLVPVAGGRELSAGRGRPAAVVGRRSRRRPRARRAAATYSRPSDDARPSPGAALARASGGGHFLGRLTTRDRCDVGDVMRGSERGPRDRPCERSAARIERDIETLAGPDFTVSGEAIRRYAYTPVYRNTLDYFTRALEELGFNVSEDPVGTLVAAQPAAGRAGVRDRLALRLEPKRRQVRRHDGRRHRARGLPAQRRARPRSAAAADLLPRGGGIGLRADAARQPDHAAARDRGGATGVVPRDRRRPQLLGARRGRRLRARRAGASRSTRSTI